MGISTSSGITALVGPGVYNPSSAAASANVIPLLLPKYRAALAKVKAGTGNCRILCVGDSITYGAYANNATSGDWRTLSWPSQLANMFNTMNVNSGSGISANSNSYCGYSLNPANDPRLTNTMAQNASNSLGGPIAYTISSGTIAFTPTVPVDTFVLWYPKISGAGTFAYNINGSGGGTQSQNASAALSSLTITAPSLGINTLNLSHSSGGNNYYIGIEAYNSAQSSILINNAGWSGATTTNWNDSTNPYSPLPSIATYAPNLTIISLGVNDWGNGVTLATFVTNLQAIITKALSVGDAILFTQPPSVVASTVPLATQLQYISATINLANTNNIPVVDLFDRWVSYEYSNPLGYYYGGSYPANLHPIGAGYADMTQALFNMIGNV